MIQTSTYQTPLLWLFRIMASLIMLQTLYFKFSASPESVYIFTKVGMEPWGRIASGVAELIASILILVPRTSWIGALLAIGVMSGAIFFHLNKLGIVVMNDGGQLFVYALLVFVCSLLILFINRQLIKQQLQQILKLKNSSGHNI
jgi:uncharacterized membrane protein YphA (DoxX/SURF4 family)